MYIDFIKHAFDFNSIEISIRSLTLIQTTHDQTTSLINEVILNKNK